MFRHNIRNLSGNEHILTYFDQTWGMSIVRRACECTILYMTYTKGTLYTNNY